MKLRAALADVAACGVALTAPPATAAQDYVRVYEYEGTYYVHTAIPGQPLVGASVNPDTGRVCVGFSLQVPVCGTVPVDAIEIQTIKLYSVDADASDGTIGVGTWFGEGQPLLGVHYNTQTGTLCAGFSYQVPQCVVISGS